MTDEVGNVILEQLQFIRSDISTLRADLLNNRNSVKHRVSQLERAVHATCRDHIDVQGDIHRHNAQFVATRASGPQRERLELAK